MMLRRILVDKLIIGLCGAALLVAVVPLFSIIYDVAVQGLPSMSLDFFTQLPPLANAPGGGLANAIQGTFITVAAAGAIGLPIGMLSGVYISEYGSRNRYGYVVRFLGDVLAGIPSIVTGILVYITIVLTFHGYSVTAGAIALGTMVIPIVSNTTSEALRSVPNSLREASAALGIRKWRTSLLVLANAKRAVSTGALLAIARITGETAPLLLTMSTSVLWFSGFNQPVATLTVYIYTFATSPFKNWQGLAWGAALVLLVIVLGINAGVRFVTRGKKTYA